MAFFEGSPVGWGGYKGSGRAVQGLWFRGGQVVGARAPGTEQIKRKKMAFFEGSPVGWGRVQGLGESGPRAVVPGG